jgi:hypothetical protein
LAAFHVRCPFRTLTLKQGRKAHNTVLISSLGRFRDRWRSVY